MERPTIHSSRFEQRAQLGSGTFGTVYEAFDRQRGQVVALKRLHKVSPDTLFRFKNEFRLLADVSHPNLVSLYELFESQGEWSFSMELIRGGHLIRHLRDSSLDHTPTADDGSEINVLAGTMLASAEDSQNLPTGAHPALPADGGLPDLENLRDCFTQLAVGLHALHERKLLHCDLKPANVLVTETGRVVLLDFGLVTQHLPEARPDHRVAGTPLYMAPEQWLGEAPTPASDWYSFGVVLYQALLGTLPHSGTFAALIEAKTQRPVTSLRRRNPRIPEDLNALCVELLAIEPQSRPNFQQIIDRLDGHKNVARPVEQTPTTVFVGRQAERSQLHKTLEICRRGGSQVVLVHGQTGLGKSTLCEQFVNEIADEPLYILRGRCYEQESLPYKALDAVVDNLSETLYALQPHSLGSLPGARELTKLFPVLARSLVGTTQSRLTLHNPIEIKRRAQRALRSILVELGRNAPILMWIDDVHWGDRDSAAIVHNTIQGVDAPRLMLLLTFRSDEIEQSPFLQEFRRLQSEQPGSVPVSQIALSKFSAGDCQELVSQLLERSQPRSNRYIRRLLQETGGSPLLIDELVRFSQARVEDSVELGVDHAQSFEQNLKLSGLLAKRIDGLPEQARQLLEVVCLAGVPLAFETAHKAIGQHSLEPRLINRMRFEHLLRVHNSSGTTQFAPYHDQVRTFTVGTLGPRRRRYLHRHLAESLAQTPQTPARLLATHYHGAGMNETASKYAQRAAQAADAALAFEDAATLYAQAMLWWPGDPDRHRLLRKNYADALVNCGRCGDAAPIYLDLHHGAPPAQGRELKRLAAQAHVTCGNLDEGLELLRQCLQDVGLTYPKTAGRAMYEIAKSLIRLKFTRIRPRPPEQEISSQASEKIETCFLVSRNVQLISPIHSMVFGARALHLSIDSGTQEQLVEGLFQVGCALAVTERKDGHALFEQGLELAKTVHSRRLSGVEAYWSGLREYSQGYWPQALKSFEASYRAFAECPGATTDLQKAEVNSILMLQLLGDFRALNHRTDEALHSAQKTGNRYSEVMATLYSAVSRLAADDLAGARTRIGEAVSRSPADTYTGFSQLKFEIWCDLYAGNPQSAVDRIEAAWPKITGSRMNSLSTFRIVMGSLRAGCLLELAAHQPNDAKKLHKQVMKTLRQLARESNPGAQGPAAMLNAALACQLGDSEQAAAHSSRAEASYSRLGRPLDQAHALRRIGEIRRDATKIAEADRVMHARGVANPQAWLRCQTPGFRPYESKN